MNAADVAQIHHIARLAVFAMCARGVSAAEFESSPEILEVRFTVSRTDGTFEFPVDVEFIGAHSMPIGGLSL
jgi:hypothetical protein